MALRRAVVALAPLLVFVLAAPAPAQCAGWLPGERVPGTNDIVRALVVLPGGDVIAGGHFTTAGGVAATSIARYNPSTGGAGTWSALGAGTNGNVHALAVMPGGDLIVGGNFTTAGGAGANRIARYNPTTGVWSALGAGTNGPVNALAVLPGGDVIAGGFFTTAGGLGANNIARCNPTTGFWSALDSGTDNTVNALAVLPGGDVIAGGSFTNAGGSAHAFFAQYTFDSAAPPSVATQPEPASTCPSGTASFTVAASGTEPFTYQWQVANPMVPGAWIDLADGPNALPFGTLDIAGADTATCSMALDGVNNDVRDLAFRCVVSNACGSVASDAASLTICPLDYNCEGVVNPDDLGDFITDYYTPGHIPGPGGYAVFCPENEPPFDAGYKTAYTPDLSGQCNPPFPDNLGDFITDYFGVGC